MPSMGLLFGGDVTASDWIIINISYPGSVTIESHLGADGTRGMTTSRSSFLAAERLGSSTYCSSPRGG